MKVNIKTFIKNKFYNKSKSINTDNNDKTNIKIIRGIFSIDGKLVAGAYYCDDKIKALATNIGCIKLDTEPKLIEDKNIKTLDIEAILYNLTNKKDEKYIAINDLC